MFIVAKREMRVKRRECATPCVAARAHRFPYRSRHVIVAGIAMKVALTIFAIGFVLVSVWLWILLRAAPLDQGDE